MDLIQLELIVYSIEEKRFVITQKGFQALDTCTKIDELLGRKILHILTRQSEYFDSFP
jgi:hypothetical protein